MSNVWRFELIGTVTASGVQFMSHVHYRTDVPVAGSEPSADAVLDHILDHYSSSGHNLSDWTKLVGSNAKLTLARVRQEVDPSGSDVPAVSEELLNLTGQLTPTGDLPPTPLCAWLRFRTAVASRSFRGGTHAPPVPSVTPFTADGALDLSTGQYATDILALAAKILDKLDNVFDTTGDINPGIYSRTRRARGESFFEELTSVTPSTQWRWLRRRMTAP